MSISLMTAVWRLDLPSSDKMVLLALADAANDDGITWMALQSKEGVKLDLLKKTSLSRRAIQGALKRLCDAGYLSRIDRPGKGVIWTVKGCSTCAPDNERGAARAPGGAADAPKPLINHSSEAKASSESAKSSEFDEFWKCYPHKKAKGAALKAYLKARKAVDHGTLVNAVATQVRWGVWADSKYSPHASTWLNNERWADEPDANTGQAGKPSAGGHRQKPASMVDILLGDRAAAANQPDVSGDGWLPTDSDGIFIRGSDSEQPF